MKIGVLEYRDEKFINDVMACLPGSEFVKFGVTDAPLEKVYDVLIDRLSFQNEFFRSIVKMYSLKGTYVINNPFSSGCDDKCLQNQLCERLGIPVPKTLCSYHLFTGKRTIQTLSRILTGAYSRTSRSFSSHMMVMHGMMCIL